MQIYLFGINSNIEGLAKKYFSGDIELAILKLNHIFEFMQQHTTSEIMFKTYAILPNKKGIFKKINDHLYSDLDSKNPDNIITIYKEISGIDWNDSLLHHNIEDVLGVSSYGFDQLVKDLNEKIADPKSVVPKTAIYQLLAYYPIDISAEDLAKRKSIWQLAKDLDAAVPDFEVLAGIGNIPNLKLWEEADKWILKNLVDTVKNAKNIPELSKILGNKDAIVWLNDSFFTFYEKYQKTSEYTEKEVFPNQKGILCKKSSLFKDAINHPLLKDILEWLGGDYRSILLDEQITAIKDFEKAEAKNVKIVANILDEINSKIKGKQYTASTDENFKKAISKLIGLFANDANNDRKKLFEAAQKIFDISAEMPPNKGWSDLDAEIFKPINACMLRALVLQISNTIDANISKFSELYFQNNENEALGWLNNFVLFVSTFEEAIHAGLLKEFAIIPNQKGVFCKKEILIEDNNIHEYIKNILFFLGKDWRLTLCHKSITTISLPKLGIKEASEEINKLLTSETKEALYYLVALFDKNDINRQKIYDFAKQILQDTLPATTKLNTSELEGFNFEKINKLIIDELVKSISGLKTLAAFKEKYFITAQDNFAPIDWLNKFILFLDGEKEYKLMLAEEALVPNQNGDFCLKSDLLWEDKNSPIDKELKKILTDFGKPIKNELLHEAFDLVLPELNCRDEQFLASEIVKRVIPKYAEDPRLEKTKNIFDALFLWFKNHKLKAENLFPDLYKNRHNLRDNDENAENMEFVDNFKNAGYTKKETEFFLKNPGNLKTILANPNLVQNAENIGKLQENDIKGLAENRTEYILAEAAKILNPTNLPNSSDEVVQALEKIEYSISALPIQEENKAIILDTLKRENSVGAIDAITSILGLFGFDKLASKYSERTIPQISMNISANDSGAYGDSSFKIKVGNWGEKFINLVLQAQKASGAIENFVWLNENGDQGKPYDFEITKKGGKKIWVDAKATPIEEAKKAELYITQTELPFLLEKENNYHIYRICGVDVDKEVSLENATWYQTKPYKILIKEFKDYLRNNFASTGIKKYFPKIEDNSIEDEKTD